MADADRTLPFAARWSRRKEAARRGDRVADEPPDSGARPVPEPAEEVPEATPVLTDADMPALDSLDENSDYSGFLSPGVSAPLRRQALAKLFHSPHLNLTDGLDDFAEDYSGFEAMGDLVTAEMRHHIEAAARRVGARDEVHPPATEQRSDIPEASGEGSRVAATATCPDTSPTASEPGQPASQSQEGGTT